MEKLVLPLHRAKSVLKDRESTNLYLRRSVKAEAATIAKFRYGWSLSELADRLLDAECKLKKGLLSRK